jgi:hypothetical protein
MHASINTVNAEAFLTTPFSLIANAVLEAKTDPEINDQLTGLIKTLGAESPAVKALTTVKAAKDAEAREEIIRLLKESGDQQMPLLAMGHDDAAMLAAQHGITNREVGDWRRRRVQEMASKGRITDQDIEREVFLKGTALDQITARLVKDGTLVRDGEGYKATELETAA